MKRGWNNVSNMREKLKQLHQKARLARDPISIEAFGSALAAIQEGEVRANTDFDEAKIIAVVEKEAGKFNESADAFEKAGRDDKAEAIRKCAELLEELLPAKLDEGAYPKIVSDAIAAAGASSMREMGAVMAMLKNEHGAALDMKLASAEVKKALS